MADTAERVPLSDFAPKGRVHGTAVAIRARAVLVIGPSGAGKSALALELMAHGAGLLADDLVMIRDGDEIVVAAPSGARPMIEARGIGLLNAPLTPGPLPLALVVDLGRSETERLPPARHIAGRSARVPLILGRDRPSLAPVILHYLAHGRAT
ncbi:serine kinase [Rhodobacterales bacterium HKCCE3408]|nr:serine kinase [Rhodobacterales bacterium HKCCE3408]